MEIDLNMSTSIESSSHASEDRANHDGNDEDEGVDEESSTPLSLEAEIEQRLEVGSKFENLDLVYVLYCEYARFVGFSVKKGTQRYFHGKRSSGNCPSDEIRMKLYLCSCEGHPDNKRSRDRVVDYKKQATRTDCKARLRVIRDRHGQWEVSIFYKVHNHELIPPDQTYLLRSARNLSHAKRSILEALKSAGIGVSRACRFMQKESGGVQNVGFTRKDAYDQIARAKRESKLENGDANALLRYFLDKSNREPFFYWNFQTDDNGRLMNFYFRDHRCLTDYEFFGDVVSVDTTYRTNKYNLICAPFVGINHHRQNVMFGLAFLSDETTTTFDWLFGSFLESMYGREPQIIFSDQCQALMKGVDNVFHHASHRLCQWHINQNAPSHFGSLNGDADFKKMWYHCMNGCETEDEFEQMWKDMIDKYRLVDNRWFKSMYNLKRRWAAVFTNNLFSAGLHATSRSEVTNKVLKDLCSATTSLHEFVLQYEQLQSDWRTREHAEDVHCRGMPGQFVDTCLLLSHAAKVYTRNIFKKFEHEVAQSLGVHLLHHPSDYSSTDLEFKVSSNTDCSRPRVVVFNATTQGATCTCHMWETEGMVCRHILKIMLIMNVTALPEHLILRRWTRAAKNRNADDPQTITELKAPDRVTHMVFVSKTMREVYELTQTFKADLRCQKIITNCIDDLKKELSSFESPTNGSRSADFQDRADNYTGPRFQDPPAAKNRSHPYKKLRKQWAKGRGQPKVGVHAKATKRNVQGNGKFYSSMSSQAPRVSPLAGNSVETQSQAYESSFMPSIQSPRTEPWNHCTDRDTNIRLTL